MADKPDTYAGTQEEWDQVMAHCDKMGRSLMNDFFDGEQAIVSEQLKRQLFGEPILTKEQVQERTERWIAKEKEIWGSMQDQS
jgi:hypothetical protein